MNAKIAFCGLTSVLLIASAVACGEGGDEGAGGEEQDLTSGPCVVKDVQQNSNFDAKTADDPFGKLVLATAKKCPITPDEVLDFMKKSGEEPNKAFIVSETGDRPESYRFVISQATKKGGPDDSATGDEEMFFSFGATANGLSAGLNEVISFSRSKKAYVYYAIEKGQWTLQGDGTQVHPGEPAPFRCATCHPTGALNMKEFEFPWNNWNSSQFDMPAPEGAEGNVKDLFARKSGAQDLETIIAKGQRAYDDARIDAILAGERKGETLATLLGQIMCDVGEITLGSSRGKNARAGKAADSIPVQAPVFVDRFLLEPNKFDNGKPQFLETLNLAAGGDFKINLSRADYQSQTDKMKLDGVAGDDTFFALFGPTRSFVDLQITEALIKRKLVTADMVADLLMTDFTNSMFSQQRCELAKTAPKAGNDAEGIRKDWIAALKKSKAAGAGELAARLEDTKDIAKHGEKVKGFLQACATRSTSEGPAFAKDIVNLTDQRRRELEEHLSAIVESPALFPEGSAKAFASHLDEASCKLVK